MANQFINFFTMNNFRIYIPELPLVSELAQDVTIPAISLSAVPLENRWGNVKQPGEKLIFTELDVGFTMDENMDAYAEIFSWMSRMAGPTGMSDIAEKDRFVLYCDVVVTMLDNTQNEIRKFIFHDCWPTSIGATSLDITAGGESVKSILTLEYTAMTMEVPTKNISNLGAYTYGH